MVDHAPPAPFARSERVRNEMRREFEPRRLQLFVTPRGGATPTGRVRLGHYFAVPLSTSLPIEGVPESLGPALETACRRDGVFLDSVPLRNGPETTCRD